MSTKIASVIAVELGLLLMILGWLVFVRLPAAGPSGAAALGNRPADSSVGVAPLRQRTERRLTVAEDVVNLVATEQAALESPAVPAYEEVLPEPYYTDAGNDLVANSEPYYSPVIEQPIIVQSPFIVVPPPVQIFESVQTSQVIIYSNSRPHRPRRCAMPLPSPGATTTTVSHRPGGGQPHPRGGDANPRRNPGPRGGDVPRSTSKATNSGPRQLIVSQQHR